jgi:rfaE bifunctional protein nucleotidyltransferase chain/domain
MKNIINTKKLVSLNYLSKILKKEKIVFTNGCFDILHSGHINILKFSKTKGDILIVGLNSNESIKKIKNKRKPYFSFQQRVKVLSEIKSVDYIVKMDEKNPIKLIKAIRPNIHVKGGDYKAKELDEYDILKSIKSKIIIFKIKHKISSSKFYKT